MSGGCLTKGGEPLSCAVFAVSPTTKYRFGESAQLPEQIDNAVDTRKGLNDFYLMF